MAGRRTRPRRLHRPGTRTRHGTYTPLDEVREPTALPAWLAQELERTGHFPASSVPTPGQYRPAPGKPS
ncbi:hypothetical protein [Streptomyces cynarae]|uniref:hypothetical protein n=1 Tax=Streptomyces cynarae TaxID=2981134 RepID=UPI0036F3B842